MWISSALPATVLVFADAGSLREGRVNYLAFRTPLLTPPVWYPYAPFGPDPGRWFIVFCLFLVGSWGDTATFFRPTQTLGHGWAEEPLEGCGPRQDRDVGLRPSRPGIVVGNRVPGPGSSPLVCAPYMYVVAHKVGRIDRIIRGHLAQGIYIVSHSLI